jgi:hypothetical protein
LERVSLHANLTILARVSQALARAREAEKVAALGRRPGLPLAIGAIAGLLPAIRAARMSHTEALWSM